MTARADTAPAGTLCVAVLGAESTGKTTLAQGLALALSQTASRQPALHQQPGGQPPSIQPLRRTAWVPEVLRQWCDQHGRTPQAHEQAEILEEQHARIDAAAREHDLVVCDTTGLMTAVYSDWVFADRSLHPRALQLHRRMDLSLLMALDLPWVPDGHQRDGPQVRGPVDSAIRRLLVDNHLPFAVIGGSGAARLQQAMAAVAPLLRPVGASPGSTAIEAGRADNGPTGGLFTRLDEGSSGSTRWLCECCGDAPYERALRRAAGLL